MMRYRYRHSGMLVEEVQVRDDTFDALPPREGRIFGVLYDRQKRQAFVNKDEVANIGDWVVREQSGRLSVCGADSFEREYEPVDSNVIPFRR